MASVLFDGILTVKFVHIIESVPCTIIPRFSETKSYKNYLGMKKLFSRKAVLLKSKLHLLSVKSVFFYCYQSDNNNLQT